MPNQTNFLNQLRYYVAKIEGDSLTIVHLTSMPTAASPKARKGFDYTSLDTATSRFVQQQTGEIRALMKRTAQDIIELGQKLIAVKEKIGHGRFGDWLEAEFKWSLQTAKRFMNVAAGLQNQQIVDFMAPSALYEIFAPSTPEAAREEALARAKAGESITYTTAKTIKQKYASPPKPKPEPISQQQPQSLPTPPISAAPLPQSASKLEIVAFRPQIQAPAIPEAARVIAPQTGVTPSAPRADQTGIVPDVPGIWWQVGGKHLLYCGDPNSPEFLERIPQKVNLLLAFPPTPSWQSRVPAKTIISLTTPPSPQSNNLTMFEDMVELMLLLYSNPGDVVINNFLPSLEILSVVNRLNRRSLLAEPNLRRCNEVITDWKKAQLKVEQIN